MILQPVDVDYLKAGKLLDVLLARTTIDTDQQLGIDQVSVLGQTAANRLVFQDDGVTHYLLSDQDFSNSTDFTIDPLQPANRATIAAYVSGIGEGFKPISPVVAATTVNLAGTYVNGVSGVGATLTETTIAGAPIVIDGITFDTIGQRVLIKDQTGVEFQNGIYELTTVGAGGIAWVFTRTIDFDGSLEGEIAPGTAVYVSAGGSVHGSQQFVLQNNTGGDDIHDVGTDSIIFVQFGETLSYNFTSGLTQTGNDVSLGGVVDIDVYYQVNGTTADNFYWENTADVNQWVSLNLDPTGSGFSGQTGDPVAGRFTQWNLDRNSISLYTKSIADDRVGGLLLFPFAGGFNLFGAAGALETEIRFIQAGGGVTDGIVIQDQIFERGLYYDADYSANWTDRSIVDKAYVDGSNPPQQLTVITGTEALVILASTTIVEITLENDWIPSSITGFIDNKSITFKFFTDGENGFPWQVTFPADVQRNDGVSILLKHNTTSITRFDELTLRGKETTSKAQILNSVTYG